MQKRQKYLFRSPYTKCDGMVKPSRHIFYCGERFELERRGPAREGARIRAADGG